MSSLTIEIEDDLRNQLEDCASRRNTTVDRLLNSVIREGLCVIAEPKNATSYVEKTYDMGKPQT